MENDGFELKLASLRQRVVQLQRPLGEEEGAAGGLGELLADLEGGMRKLIGQNQRLEEALQEAEGERGRYQDLFEFSPNTYLMTTGEGVIRQANRAAATMFKVEQALLVGRDLMDFVVEEDRRGFRAQLALLKEGRLDGMRDWEVRIRPSGSSFLPAAITVTASQDEQGRPLALRWVICNIDKRKRAERALEQSLHQWQTTFDAMSEAVCLLDLEGRILRANQAMAVLARRPVNALLGSRYWEVIHGTDQPHKSCPFSRMLETGEPETSVSHWNDRWFNVFTSPLHEEDGTFRRAIHIIADITDLKRAEEALHESEEKFRCLFDFSHDAILIADPFTGRYLDCNRKAEKILGYTREEILAIRVGDMTPHSHRQEAWENIQRLLREGELRTEMELLTKDGRRIPLEICASVIEVGGKTCIHGNFRDMTERREMEQALRKSEARYRAIVEDQTEFINRFLPGGEMTFVNRACGRHFGVEPEELMGKSFFPLIHEEDREDVVRVIASVSQESPVCTVVHRVVRLDGELRWHRWTNRGIFDQEGRLVEYQAVGRDITESKRVEEALRYRCEFESIVSSLATAFMGVGPEELDRAIHGALMTMGEFADVDRSYVFQFTNERGWVDNTHEWCREGIAPQAQRLKGFPLFERFPSFSQSMRRLEVFYAPFVADLPPEAAAEREEFQSQDIQSLVCIPMVCGGRLVGFVGFDSVRQRKTWTEEIIDLLRIVGVILANALACRSNGWPKAGETA